MILKNIVIKMNRFLSFGLIIVFRNLSLESSEELIKTL